MNKELMEQAMLDEIKLVLTDPQSKLSNGAQYALRYVYQQIQAITEAEKQEQRKPLTDKQIDEIYFKSDLNIDDQYHQMYAFVKAIESAHGIKELNHD